MFTGRSMIENHVLLSSCSCVGVCGCGCQDVTHVFIIFHVVTRFKAKAESDIAIITRYIHTALQSVGFPISHITDHEITYFVKNVRSLRVIATRSLEEEYQHETVRSDDMSIVFIDVVVDDNAIVISCDCFD